MPINDANATAALRRPRMRILMNKAPVGGAESMEVNNNNYYQADTFHASFALWADPAFGPKWWGDQTEMLLDLQASLDGGSSWTSLIIGEVDRVSISLEHGSVKIDGRDLTRRFIDNKTQETFLNNTASEIVAILASRRGLTADVTRTETPVSRYYEDDHDRISHEEFSHSTTEWNLLTSLAQHENFDVYVTGTTLHFHPQTPVDADPWVLKFSHENNRSTAENATAIHLDRSLTLAKDVIVYVRSHNSQTGRSITKFSPSGARMSGVTSGKAQIFTRYLPEATEQQAQDYANKIREEITKHERLLDFDTPGDLILTARNMVRLEGSGSSFDQPYYVDSVSRHIARDGAFHMSVKCKNHSPQTQVFATS